MFAINIEEQAMRSARDSAMRSFNRREEERSVDRVRGKESREEGKGREGEDGSKQEAEGRIGQREGK